MKLLACDFDGTLYQNKTITHDNQRMLKEWQAQGNIFVIATGRDYTSLLNKLTSYDLQPDYIIGNNGATIDQSLINEINKKDAQKVLQQIDTDTFTFNHVIISILDPHSGTIENKKWTRKESYLSLDRTILQLAIQAKSSNAAKKIAKKYQQCFPNLVFLQNIQTVDIVAPATDKANTIGSLAKHLNISSSDIFTIGDGLNDINMLKQYRSASFPWVAPEVLAVANSKVNSVSDWLGSQHFVVS